MKNKTLLKILSTFLAVVMILCSAPLSGFTGIELPELFSVKAEAYTDGNFTYSVYYGEATLTGCIDATGDIVIPETLGGYPVTSIDNYVFQYCTSLTSITIPDSVINIGNHAFYGCSSLTSVTIGNSVTSIEGWVFNDCTSLTDVYYTGDIASWCNISFGNYYANPMYYAKNFYINNVLQKEIAIPDTVTEIKSHAFYNFKDITAVKIPDSVTDIGDSAFYGCTSLTSVTIGDRVTSIDNYAFQYCTSLTSITIPDSVTSIGYYAFGNCTSLASITIPDSVINIGVDAFYDCASLARVYYIGDIASWCKIDFGYPFANPMYYAKNFYINNVLQKEIVIPDTVTEIKDYAFYSFEGITSVTIPDGITGIGSLAFSDCTSLTDVYYMGDIESWCNIVFGDYRSNPMSEGNNFYIDNAIVTEIVIPETVTEIKDYVFQGFDNITSVVIPDGIKGIGKYAFYRCEKLTSIVLPVGVAAIGERAFLGCYSLETAVIPEGVTIIANNAFYDCYDLASITIPESVITIREDAFVGCHCIENVYYAGTDEQWDEIAIYDGNDCLKNANKTFLNGGHAHVYNSSVTTEPTCTETGVKTYKCYCGNTYTESIPATGHIWGKWIVTLEPTATKDGRKVRACTACVEAVQEETIPKGTTPDEPDFPEEPETKFSVKVNDFTLNYKGTAKLNPEIKSLLKYDVEYSSSDESVVTVDKDGNVTATGEGTAEITVRVTNTFGMTVEDTCKVTVAKAWWQWLIIIFLFGWIWY